MFSTIFLNFLVITGLVWPALAAPTLIVLLLRDWKNHELW